METMKTTIHAYRFDTSNILEETKYLRLCEHLEAQGLWVAKLWAPQGSHFGTAQSIDGQTIELEPEYLFDNQWNTAPIAGHADKRLRVFDWVEDCWPNQAIRSGYYLAQTEAMIGVRIETAKCGYCGAQETIDAPKFCPHCLDNPYLGFDELHLTRMVPVTDANRRRAPLTEDERKGLMPRYIHAQTQAEGSRAVQRQTRQRSRVIEGARKAIQKATFERDGLLWMLDNGVPIDNCIYYAHRDIFTFGWRNPASPEVGEALHAAMALFPWRYEVRVKEVNTNPPMSIAPGLASAGTETIQGK